jgi:hypothetical protein
MITNIFRLPSSPYVWVAPLCAFVHTKLRL